MQQDGNAAFKAGDHAKAIMLYSKCLELDSTVTAAHANRAMAYLKVGKPQEALEDCQVVLQREPENVKCWLRKGQAHHELNQGQEALRAWEHCLKVQPGNAQALELLQQLEFDTNMHSNG